MTENTREHLAELLDKIDVLAANVNERPTIYTKNMVEDVIETATQVKDKELQMRCL